MPSSLDLSSVIKDWLRAAISTAPWRNKLNHAMLPSICSTHDDNVIPRSNTKSHRATWRKMWTRMPSANVLRTSKRISLFMRCASLRRHPHTLRKFSRKNCTLHFVAWSGLVWIMFYATLSISPPIASGLMLEPIVVRIEDSPPENMEMASRHLQSRP